MEILREPGGTDVSESVRAILLDPARSIDAFAELLLFSAARAQLVAEKIRPLLNAGTVVLCDRFFDSTTAYQGFGREIAEPAWLDAFHRRVTGGLVPNRTYYIKVSPEVARSRRNARAEDDRMEASGAPFYKRVAAGYEWLARSEPERILELDGTRRQEDIARAIREDVERLMAGTGSAAPGSSRNSE